MSSHRFFVPEDWITRSTVVITGMLVHRLRKVLRLRPGAQIIVLDDTGWEYEVELKSVESDEIEGAVLNRNLAAGEPRTRITLYQALLKGSNFELVLQKCTEVGVSEFVPVLCERCVAGEPDSKRLDRWKSIIVEAAEQSKRGNLPALRNVTTFNGACNQTSGLSFIPWEGEAIQGIGDILKSNRNVAKVSIFAGPEGGFSAEEIELARSRGIMPVSLGHRTLRAETAGLVAAAIILYEFGDINI
ncbi:MAG: 16S rRNA (uracil(1498)-N(3))-methyltransferase [Chloroflexi bacterium]|nr:16S rRNA (uracil(1498)-N(3))-methyltransferase [Chloroflexota bacterium]